MFQWYWPTTGMIYVWRRGFGRWVVRRGVVWDGLVLQAVAVEDGYDTYCIGRRLGLYVGSLADRRPEGDGYVSVWGHLTYWQWALRGAQL